jgi:drug/metabolite transporter (DMT)-like permease
MSVSGGAGSVSTRWLAVVSLMLIALSFSINHIGARLAMDHGVSVLTAVTVRSTGTVIAVSVLLVLARARWQLDRKVLSAAAAAGCALAVQGYCLYSAVALLPVALALLVFNTFPIMIALLSWAVGGERPRRRTVLAWPVILAGLALALDIPEVLSDLARTADHDSRSMAIRMLAGIGFGLGAAASFAVTMVITAKRLSAVDGRIRTLLTVSVVGALAGSIGFSTSTLAWPTDVPGWTGLGILSVFYALAITALFVILPRVGAVNNSPILNVEPIFAMGLAALFLGQRLEILQVLGGVLVVGSIIFLSMSGGRR